MTARRTWWLTALALVTLALGCGEVVRPQVLVRIDAREETAARLRWIRVRVIDQEGEVVRDQVARIGTGEGEVMLPATVPLTPAGEDPTRRWTVEAEGFDTDAEPPPGAVGFVQLRAQGRYVPDEVVELLVRFDASCPGPCPDGQTCAGGVCVGACYDVTTEGPARPTCGECQRCVLAECEARDPGEACGCPGETCNAEGLCDVVDPVRDVSAGLDATCVTLRSGGELYCWGNNAESQLGIEGVSEAETPQSVGTSNFDPIDLGGFAVAGNTTYGCGVSRGGSLLCWGQNGASRLGPDPGPYTTPTEVPIGFEAEQVRLGCVHTCFTDRSGALFCMGRNAIGMLGRGTMGSPESSIEPVVGAMTWLDFDLGHAHTCGVANDNRVYCWGFNDNFELGIPPDTNPRDVPTVVDLGDRTDFISVTLGAFHACALRENGEAYCWGGANFGNLGRPNVEGGAGPARVSLDEPLSSLRCGRSHCCGVTTDGALYCWGRNDTGQLGLGRTSAGEPIPQRLGGTLAWEEFDGGEAHSCAVTTRGAVYCWGDNAFGQLGVGDREPRLVPTRVCL